MNNRTATAIRKYAQLRGLNYEICKKLYQSSSPEVRKTYRDEMKLANETATKLAK